jgi:hypothetical protein
MTIIDKGIVNVGKNPVALLINTNDTNKPANKDTEYITLVASLIPVCRTTPLYEPIIRKLTKAMAKTKGCW